LSVRLGRSKLRIIAAWLGLLALAFNALVPIHLAFDLAGALAGDGPEHASHHHPDGHSLLAALVGHRHNDGKSDAPPSRGHLDCAVCGSISTLAGFAGTSTVTLGIPAFVGAPALRTAVAVVLCGASSTAYRSRAPPVG
jgi:hypothetical protein